MATQSTTVEIVMPSVGESITEGTVLEWLKQVGDTVAEGDAVVEISTDKVDGEVFAPTSGVLTKILAETDETVTVGQVLGEIEAGEAPAEAEPEPEPEGEAPEPSEGAGEIVDVAIPEMGDSVAEGTILEWLVKPGDTVAKDDPLVEISTDKVDAELPSPVAGTVTELLVEPDETVAVGTVVCRIEAGEGAPGGTVSPPAEATAAKPAAETPAPTGNGDGNATPVAARMAADHGLDIDKLSGSGPRGRVTKADVEAALEGNGQPAAAPAGAEPDPRPRRHARAVHGREPLDPHRHQLPHAAGGRALAPTAPSSSRRARSSPSPT